MKVLKLILHIIGIGSNMYYTGFMFIISIFMGVFGALYAKGSELLMVLLVFFGSLILFLVSGAAFILGIVSFAGFRNKNKYFMIENITDITSVVVSVLLPVLYLGCCFDKTASGYQAMLAGFVVFPVAAAVTSFIMTLIIRKKGT